jgi:DNA-binding phage protein
MTETAIARKANIDRNTLRNYRKHEQSPTLRALEKIGKVVGFKLTVEKCKKPRG